MSDFQHSPERVQPAGDHAGAPGIDGLRLPTAVMAHMAELREGRDKDEEFEHHGDWAILVDVGAAYQNSPDNLPRTDEVQALYRTVRSELAGLDLDEITTHRGWGV